MTTVKLERQEIINSGVTTMDMTVVGPELVNWGVTSTMDRTVVGQEIVIEEKQQSWRDC